MEHNNTTVALSVDKTWPTSSFILALTGCWRGLGDSSRLVMNETTLLSFSASSRQLTGLAGRDGTGDNEDPSSPSLSLKQTTHERRQPVEQWQRGITHKECSPEDLGLGLSIGDGQETSGLKGRPIQESTTDKTLHAHGVQISILVTQKTTFSYSYLGLGSRDLGVMPICMLLHGESPGWRHVCL